MKNKKTLVYLVIMVLLLLISFNIQIVAYGIGKNTLSLETINVNHQFSIPIVKEGLNGINIQLQGINKYNMIAGQPILPIYIETIELPLGTRVKNIICTTSKVNEFQITKNIVPGLQPVPWIDITSLPQLKYDCAIYKKDTLFPEEWYKIRSTAGLNKANQHTTFLSIQFNPVRYNSVKNTILSVTSINL